MDPNSKIPTIEEVKSFLEEYGWSLRETTSENGQRAILSNYNLDNSEKGILISLRIEGEFVVASTVNFLQHIPKEYASRLLRLNDTLKLVKLYSVNSADSDILEVELGFELWRESWNKGTFSAFMDMLTLGIEKVLMEVETDKIPHETTFITYQ